MKIGNIREMDIPEMIQQAWKGVLNTWEVSSETEVEIPAALQIQVNQDTGLTSLLNMMPVKIRLMALVKIRMKALGQIQMKAMAKIRMKALAKIRTKALVET